MYVAKALQYAYEFLFEMTITLADIAGSLQRASMCDAKRST